MNIALDALPLPLRFDDDGVVRVGKTRVTLDTVVAAFKNGSTAEQIAHDYDVLELPDIYAVIAFYLARRKQVDAYFEQQHRESKQFQQVWEKQSDSSALRERLLARRQKEVDDVAVPDG